MDDSELREFNTFLKSLPEKSESTLQCFDRGDVYSLYNHDAIVVCNELYGNTAKMRTINLQGGKSISYLSIRKVNAENFFRHFLLKRHYRLEVFTRKARNQCDWRVEFRASPGNLEQFEDILFTNSTDVVSSSTILSLKLTTSNNDIVLSAVLCDSTAHTLQLCEFSDSEELFHLVALLAQIDCYECLLLPGLPIDSTPMKNVRQILKRAGILMTDTKKDSVSSKEILSTLELILKRPKDCPLPLKSLGNDLTDNCLACLAAILKFLKLKDDESSHNSYQISQMNLEGFVRLDSVALTTLNILPSAMDKNRFQSLYGVLNNCRTPQGQRLLLQWIRQPLMDKHVIDERLDIVESLFLDNQLRSQLFDDFLRRIPDMQKLSKRLGKSKNSLQDCYRLYQAVKRHSFLKKLLEEYSGEKKHIFFDVFVKPLNDMSDNFSKFIELIESTVDMERVKDQEYLVRDDFDENLTELREKMNELEERIQKEFQKVARTIGLEPNKNIKLEFSMPQGYVLKITRKEEIRIRDIKSLVVLETQKAGVKFRNSAIASVSDEYVELKDSYAQQQRGIVDEILKVVKGYMDMFQQYNNLLAVLDAHISLAVAAINAPTQYVRPKLLPRGSGRIVLKKCRHPCLEMQESMAFIANDFMAEKGVNSFHIITGPNMGGKSTYIRSVGMIVLMAQIGSFVPCEFAEISIVDGIMTRVGSCDYQMQGVSTFLAEMLETSYFISTATKDSLIIIDELGRGTSTYDGFGLAWSIASYVAQDINAFSLFATHFHELTDMESQIPGVCNQHVQAAIVDGELVMLHRIMPGPSSQSLGIHVAKMANLPQPVIQYAENVAKDFESLQILQRSQNKRDENDPNGGLSHSPEDYLKELKTMKKKFCELNLNDLSPAQLEDCRRSLLESIYQNPILNELAAKVPH